MAADTSSAPDQDAASSAGDTAADSRLRPPGGPVAWGQLQRAVEAANCWKVRYLIRQGVPLNAHAPGVLVTALQIADARRRRHMFSWLVGLGADVQAVDPATGRDVLLWAAHLNRGREADVVLEAGAAGDLDLRRQDAEGYTALHYAVLHDNTRLLERLAARMTKYGLSVDLPDPRGFTPYLQAVRMRHEECARILLEVGGADRGLHDTTAFISDRSWRHVGEQDRSQRARQRNEQRAGVYRAMGRLPQLRAAKFNTKKVQVIHSKKESERLEHLDREDTLSRISHSFHLPPLQDGGTAPGESRRPSLLTTSLPNLSLEAPPSPKTHGPSSPRIAPHQAPRDHNLHALLDIYTDQLSPGYRRTAPRTGDPHSWKTSTSPEFEPGYDLGFAALRGISKFALMMRKRKMKKKPGEGGMRLGVGLGQARGKGRSPARSVAPSPAGTEAAAAAQSSRAT